MKDSIKKAKEKFMGYKSGEMYSTDFINKKHNEIIQELKIENTKRLERMKNDYSIKFETMKKEYSVKEKTPLELTLFISEVHAMTDNNLKKYNGLGLTKEEINIIGGEWRNRQNAIQSEAFMDMVEINNSLRPWVNDINYNRLNKDLVSIEIMENDSDRFYKISDEKEPQSITEIINFNNIID